MDEERLKYWIALRAVEEVGAVGFKTLLAAFPSPRDVFSAPAAMLQAVPGIGPKTAANICSFSDWEMAEQEILRTAKLGASIVTCEDPAYPRNLLNIYDYPPFLYVKGSLVPDEIAVALVGSRLASPYGRYVTETLSRALALQGVTVVSGLARGIDAAAHRGALAGKGRTVAVLGCGLDLTYPPENAQLAEAVAAQGALVTEFPLGTPPNAPNFPSRNRIISGISLGVVVVEAGEKSGSLITARIAGEQGRSVFAVPGAIDSAGSRGTHRLIKEGAKLVENVEDIIEEVLPQAGTPVHRDRTLDRPAAEKRPRNESDPPSPIPGLGDREKRLLPLIPTEPVGVDQLITTSALTAQEVLNGLLVLELCGLIRQLPGKMFQRKEPST
ncbi:MAG: DNA-processing protein DprA [Deltaproteobacteria bacterium]|nr:DNA-processing protein DprA [Deltaproteobacteria bacterium]